MRSKFSESLYAQNTVLSGILGGADSKGLLKIMSFILCEKLFIISSSCSFLDLHENGFAKSLMIAPTRLSGDPSRHEIH